MNRLIDEDIGQYIVTQEAGRTCTGQKRMSMKRDTIAIHGGYEVDPTTKAVAVPIYQTVSYAFHSADHAAALFNLEAEGYR